MTSPISDFCYTPLSGKIPLEVNFINLSKNLGGTNPWNSCRLGKKYFYSALNNLSNPYAIDFTGISCVNAVYGEDGLILSSGPTSVEGISNWQTGDYIIHNGNKWFRVDKTYQPGPQAINFKGVWDSSSNTPLIGNNGNGGVRGDFYKVDVTGNMRYPGSIIDKHLEDVSIDCSDDFMIQFEVVRFDNWHGIIELYFHEVIADVYKNNPGIHINTIGQDPSQRGYVRGINNYGQVKEISSITFPAIFKFEKNSDFLNLYVNDQKIHSLGAALMGLDTGIHKLRLKMLTQTDVKDWVMHIRNIYVQNKAMPDSCQGSPAQFLWNFDDGEVSTEMHPIHTYVQGGVKTVSLTTTTEHGASVFAQNIYINGSGEPVENAEQIYNDKKAAVVRNINSIPNYCADTRLRQLINIAIHDAVRHADIIQDSVTAKIKTTISELVNGKRNMRCETSYVSGLFDDVKTNLVSRTVVEPEKQNDLVDVSFEYDQS